MLKIVILESNEELLEDMRATFERDAAFAVCGVSGSGSVGINLINQYKPDVVVLDTVLSGEDGFGVMKYVKENLPTCGLFVVSGFSDDKLVGKAIFCGAKYYFVKPVSAEVVCERVKELTSGNSSESGEIVERKRSGSVEERVSSIFISIGIPPHIKGYRYLREGIRMAVEDPHVINNVTKVLYPKIGEKYATSASKVERAIRHAIEVAWNRGRIDAINSIFGARVYLGAEKPTNSEFIALVADKLILDGMS